MGCPARGIPGAEGDVRMKNLVKESAVGRRRNRERKATLLWHRKKEHNAGKFSTSLQSPL
eukprot:1084612-Pelagomonas_calceolata.AAC.1